jgi:hypothetical protein
VEPPALGDTLGGLLGVAEWFSVGEPFGVPGPATACPGFAPAGSRLSAPPTEETSMRPE